MRALIGPALMFLAAIAVALVLAEMEYNPVPKHSIYVQGINV